MRGLSSKELDDHGGWADWAEWDNGDDDDDYGIVDWLVLIRVCKMQ